MSAADLAYLEASCKASGVPVQVDDPALVERLASLLQSGGDD